VLDRSCSTARRDAGRHRRGASSKWSIAVDAITDGQGSCAAALPVQIARALARRGIRTFVIGLGTEDGSDGIDRAQSDLRARSFSQVVLVHGSCSRRDPNLEVGVGPTDDLAAHAANVVDVRDLARHWQRERERESGSRGPTWRTNGSSVIGIQAARRSLPTAWNISPRSTAC
jgi:hypothetical protein